MVKKRLFNRVYTSVVNSFRNQPHFNHCFYNAGIMIVYRFKNPANKINNVKF